MPSTLRPVALGLRGYISGKYLMPMLQLLHIATFNDLHLIPTGEVILLLLHSTLSILQALLQGRRVGMVGNNWEVAAIVKFATRLD